MHDCEPSLFEKCINTEGNYSCACKDGYYRNMGLCEGNACYDIIMDDHSHLIHLTDIDECTVNEDICGSNSNCSNLNPGFRCNCHPGYRHANKTTCVGEQLYC